MYLHCCLLFNYFIKILVDSKNHQVALNKFAISGRTWNTQRDEIKLYAICFLDHMVGKPLMSAFEISCNMTNSTEMLDLSSEMFLQ